jgi:predicted nuclease of predicted toxin-antitoxin system
VKLKVDENLPVEFTAALDAAGHDASDIVQQQMKGAHDPDVAAVCQREGRVLVTLDLDFADIRAYPPAEYPGIVVLRVRRQDKPYSGSFFTAFRMTLSTCMP